MQFGYFYGNEAEQFTFYRIPKVLITAPQFKKVSDSAKILYGLMLDRMGLSIKNGWFDEQNRVYIYFTVEDIMELMDCKSQKATKLAAELDTKKGIGLIERVKQGQGKPAKIYIKKFINTYDDMQNSRVSQNKNQDFPKSKPQTFENQKCRLSQTESADFRNSKCNYNNKNNTKMNDTDFNKSINQSAETAEIKSTPDTVEERWIDRYNKTISEIKEQIDYDSLIYTNNAEIVNNIVNVMAEVMLIDVPYYTIEGKQYPAELVRINYRQITYGKMEAFLIEYGKIYRKIGNTKAYLITALYNIPLTADAALSNRVKSDMYGGR